MKLLMFFVLFGFVLGSGAEEVDPDHVVFLPEGGHYVFDEKGDLVPAGLVVIGETSLRGACVAGKTFDQETFEYDADRQDFYYTITNNADTRAVISITTADKEGLFCSTPFRVLESGQCLKVYEKDRLQTLASVTVNDEILCDGWLESRPLCELNRSYEIINAKNNEEINSNYLSNNYGLTFNSTVNETDCEIL